MNYYKLLFIPTAARYLADIKDRDVDISFDYPLYYFPETNQLVVNNLSQIHYFNKSLSKDLITDLNYPQLTAILNKKGNLSEYKIVSSTEYAKYLIKTVVDKNNQSIRSDMALYQSNLNIISECRTTEMENKKLVDGQTNDYQNNCVQSRLYSNCNQLKDRIAENIKISETTSALCRKNESLVKQYNTEILKNIEIFKNNIEEVNKKGTLERNKAELGAAIFMPPNSIYFKDDKLVYSLVYNSVHEFLHYIVSSKDRDLSPYIDEAMTDYLTFKALGYDKYLSVAISGYYTEQQILLSLLEKISFDEMLNVYISGKDKKFQEIFGKYYPETSYIEFSKIGKNIYETTYEVDGKKRNFNPMSTHSYMYSKDVEKARALLGLEKSLSYSALKDLF